MTTYNPDWQDYTHQTYAQFIPDEVFKYRSAELDEVLKWQREHFAKIKCMNAPALLEIGSNRGRFLLGLAQARRDHCVFGIEMKPSLSRITAKKIARRGLDNAYVLNADAMIAMPVIFEPASLEAIFLLFPDPWWKKKHERRRLFSDRLIGLAKYLLVDGGHLVLRTDVEAYYERSLEAIVDYAAFEVVARGQVPFSDMWVHTTRERHCIRDGLPVYELCLKYSADT